MKLAVLGGSFNPIHIGHLVLADEVCNALEYDKVLFIPTYTPPHKELNNAVDAALRLEMVRLACSKDDRFEAESCEIDRKGVSYTYDTICYLEQKYASSLDSKIGLIMGDDLLPGFHLWHKAEELSRKCQLIVAHRPCLKEAASFSNKPSGEYADAKFEDNLFFDYTKDALFTNAVQLENSELPVSSTDIRTRAGEGRAFKYLVPADVFNYIIQRRLYGYGN